jgi:hypothetical protein
LPKAVRVKVMSGGQVIAEAQLDFRHNFVLEGPYIYVLKSALTIDATQSATPTRQK